MKIAVAATAEQKQELLQPGLAAGTTVEWIENFHAATDADAIIDLLFDTGEKERLTCLKNLPQKIVIINDVNGWVQPLPAHFIRVNGWPGFLSRTIAEANCGNEQIKPEAERVFSALGRKTEWTTGTPGFITARTVAMIINEAYFVLQENISTKKEIDIAMKTGTNYPYGPFEWCDRIGIKKIYTLLKKLEETDNAYRPCDLLTKEAIS